MVQINDRVLTAATQRGQNLLNEEVVALIERYHPHEQPGISREALEAYATALANEPQYRFDVGEFLDAVDEQVTDVETWAGDGMLYPVKDHLNAYPARWHAELGGLTDVREYLRFLREGDPGFNPRCHRSRSENPRGNSPRYRCYGRENRP